MPVKPPGRQILAELGRSWVLRMRLKQEVPDVGQRGI
jgi:hypothetical protein